MTRIKCLLPCLVAGLLVAAVTPAFGSVAAIGASRDATIFQNNPNNGSGAGNGLFAGTNGQSSPRRGLIYFDIAGALPAAAVVQSVQLNLTLGQVAGSGGGGGAGGPSIELHRLLAEWGEESSPPTDALGGQGQGLGAVDGDVTWISRFQNASPAKPWATAGGDFAAAASAATNVGTLTSIPYAWTSPPTLVTDVQGWLNSPATNFGWMLKNADETSATTFRAFYSRSVATAAFRPELAVTYEIPEPASCSVPATASLGGAKLRRRQKS